MLTVMMTLMMMTLMMMIIMLMMMMMKHTVMSHHVEVKLVPGLQTNLVTKAFCFLINCQHTGTKDIAVQFAMAFGPVSMQDLQLCIQQYVAITTSGVWVSSVI